MVYTTQIACKKNIVNTGTLLQHSSWDPGSQTTIYKQGSDVHV
jgi:hypothetical protein